MATNEEVLEPKSLVIPKMAGAVAANGPDGLIFLSGGKLLMISGTSLVTITKA